jgi:hypothetical protein
MDCYSLTYFAHHRQLYSQKENRCCVLGVANLYTVLGFVNRLYEVKWGVTLYQCGLDKPGPRLLFYMRDLRRHYAGSYLMEEDVWYWNAHHPKKFPSLLLARLSYPMWVIHRLSEGRLTRYILNFSPKWRTDVGRDVKCLTEAKTGLCPADDVE